MKGKKYGKLTVVGPEESERNPNTGKLIRHVWCKCDCGNMYRAIISALPIGRAISCGCELERAKQDLGRRRHNGEIFSPGGKSHGMTNTRIHRIWCNMKTRCYNPNAG